jgi:hypothetical protein
VTTVKREADAPQNSFPANRVLVVQAMSAGIGENQGSPNVVELTQCGRVHTEVGVPDIEGSLSSFELFDRTSAAQ